MTKLNTESEITVLVRSLTLSLLPLCTPQNEPMMNWAVKSLVLSYQNWWHTTYNLRQIEFEPHLKLNS